MQAAAHGTTERHRMRRNGAAIVTRQVSLLPFGGTERAPLVPAWCAASIESLGGPAWAACGAQSGAEPSGGFSAHSDSPSARTAYHCN